MVCPLILQQIFLCTLAFSHTSLSASGTWPASSFHEPPAHVKCPEWSPSHALPQSNPRPKLNSRIFLEATHFVICSCNIKEPSFLTLGSFVHLHLLMRCLSPQLDSKFHEEGTFLVPQCIPALSTTLGIDSEFYCTCGRQERRKDGKV